MRSPFLPEIFAQSSGLVVLGRSSCSLYSCLMESIRSWVLMPLPCLGDLALDGQLLGPPDDVLDHRPGSEVLVVHDLLVTVLIGDLEELVHLVVPVHLLDRRLDHEAHGLLPVAATQAPDLSLFQR